MTGVAHNISEQHSSLIPSCLVVFTCFCFGTIPFFAKSLTDAGIAPYAVAFYRYGLSSVILLPLLIQLSRTKLRIILWGMASGVAVGLGWVGYVHALKTIPVSTAGVLYMTYPVFTILIGWLFFRDKPSPRAGFASILVVIAAVLARSPAAVEPQHLPVMLASLSAPITFGVAINVLIFKLQGLKPLARVASFSLGSSLGLLPLLITAAPGTVFPDQAEHWWLVAGLALGTALIPQLIYSINAPKIGAARAAMAWSIELPTMFLIGGLLLGEQIGIAQWLGGALVTIAILLTPARAHRRVAHSLPLSET
ncbi:MAG: DMT family transporter, partial [Pseudomonadota bacterium]